MQKIKYLVCFVFLMPLIGCEKLPNGFPSLYSAAITVTQEGTPLTDADVMLYSIDDPTMRWIIVGRTDANGKAVMTTFAGTTIRKNGVPAGKFKVTVNKVKTDEYPVLSPFAADAEIAAYRKEMEKLKPLTHYYVDKQNTNIDTTPLEVTVEKKTNSLTVDAGKKTEWTVPVQY
ncbi:MAG: hypothetical protein FWE67_08525 [Planctomycetaceae bacterium]|nr:hypothetical protein [Planctomycetaceae bacterium]